MLKICNAKIKKKEDIFQFLSNFRFITIDAVLLKYKLIYIGVYMCSSDKLTT